MRRADRLFRIVDLMRGGGVITAARLADALEVSVRTIYRDVADLMASGVPITGEAGTGYVLGHGLHLPPMMLTEDEVVALVGGLRMMRAWGGDRLAGNAATATQKVMAVLPDAARSRAEAVHIHALRMPGQDALTARLDEIERASSARLRLTFDYIREDGTPSRRTVRPLGLWYWGRTWTLVSWCELRDDFRMFRVDRMADLATGDAFPTERGKTFSDFQRAEICAHDHAARVPRGG